MFGQFRERFVVTLLSQVFANLYSDLHAAERLGKPDLEGPTETRAPDLVRVDIGMTTRNDGSEIESTQARSSRKSTET